jgi:mono/diheme cytochrome c family protein
VRILLFAFLAIPLAAAPKTVWDGVFTVAQADRGQVAYAAECSRCHGEDLRASGNVLLGEKFDQQWREDSLKSMFTILRNTMPRNAPRSLPDAQYTDIMAYLLKMNKFPAGSEELAVDRLDSIQFVGKNGPSEVPDFALVSVTGCLVSVTGDLGVVRGATEPARSRNPDKSTGDELSAAMARSAGKHDFSLLSMAYFAADVKPGHKAEIKGFLIRDPKGDKINVTSAQTGPATCAP